MRLPIIVDCPMLLMSDAARRDALTMLMMRCR